MEVAFGHWSASWPVLIAYVLAAGWHLAGLRRLLAANSVGNNRAGTPARRELRREAVLCQLGLLLVQPCDCVPHLLV